MRIFNKIFIILILLFLIVVSGMSIVNEFAGFFKWSDVAASIFNPDVNINPFLSMLALLLVIALSVFMLMLEFRKKRIKTAQIKGVKTGQAMITVKSLAANIKNEINKIEGVNDINVGILPKSSGIILNLSAKLGLDEGVPEKMEEVIIESSKLVSEKFGVKVLKTNLTLTDLASGKKKSDSQEDEAVEEDRNSPESGENAGIDDEGNIKITDDFFDKNN